MIWNELRGCISTRASFTLHVVGDGKLEASHTSGDKHAEKTHPVIEAGIRALGSASVPATNR